MARVMDLVTVTTLEISLSVVYSSVWSKEVLLVHGHLGIIHGRATWTIRWTNFTVVGAHVLSLLWTIIRPNGPISPGRILGRTRDGIIFLLSYHYPFFLFITLSFFYNYYIINWIWINTQKLLIEKGILFSSKNKKILSIFSNCDERKIVIINL